MQKINLILAAVYVSLFQLVSPKSAITSKSCGRLGDSAVILSKTLLLSFGYKCEFLYTPLPGLEHFVINTIQKKISSNQKNTFTHQHYITTHKAFIKHISKYKNTLYTANIHSNLHIKTSLWPKKTRPGYKHNYPSGGLFEYAIEHPNFLTELKRLLTPIKKINKIELPRDKMTIAVHVRKPSRTDPQLLSVQQYEPEIQNHSSTHAKNYKNYADKIWPLKFPPDQYYIDQLKKLSKILNHPPLYVHIFTDHKNPHKIMERYKAAVKLPNIVFNCIEKNSNMIDDLFNMMEFDCFISSLSHFAWTAQLLGKHKLIINPIDYKWKNNILYIPKTKIVFPDRKHNTVAQYLFDGDTSHLHNEIVTALH